MYKHSKVRETLLTCAFMFNFQTTIFMLLQPNERIFDTLVDTTKLYVSMKTYFAIRPYDKDKTKSLIYLIATGGRLRERINVDVQVATKDWNVTDKKLKSITKDNQDKNLILENINSKITAIKTAYRLSERLLTPALLKKELASGMPRVDFLAFFAHALEDEKPLIGKDTYRRYVSTLEKLRKFQSDIPFSNMDYNWFDLFRKHHLKKGNQITTINGNISTIKKFMRLAQRNGIKLKIDLLDVKVGTTRGNRISLTSNEIQRFSSYLFSEFIKDVDKLVVGYFLFSCMTGLRFSDVLALNRENITDDYVSFVSKKTKKDQTILFNVLAKKIINDNPMLFVRKHTNEYINRELKRISLFLGIHKSISFHVARHTFATTYLRAGGRVEKLQKLLGHSKIEETMIYVHIVSEEANIDILLMDDYLKLRND